MNTRRHALAFVLALALAAGPLVAAEAAAVAKPNSAMPPRFKQVRERIDALYQQRNHAPSPPQAGDNPFRAPGAKPLPGTAPPASSEEAQVADVKAIELATLEEAAATLRISGIFEIGGELYLVINARPYKAGDVVPATVQGEAVYLRIREVARHTVTLALNDTEKTLAFGAPRPKAEKNAAKPAPPRS